MKSPMKHFTLCEVNSMKQKENAPTMKDVAREAGVLQVPHKTRYRYLRRDAHQHMYMIRADFRFMDLYSFPLT